MIPVTRQGLGWAVIILISGALYSIYFGSKGLHPLDSGIVFQGAWSRMSGREFFVDVDSPNGFVPMALQVLFFKVFGVNWWSYTLHAGLINGCFGLLIFAILRMAGLVRWMSALFGLLSCVTFYPPMGVPYMEQHAFFFLLLSLAIAIKSTFPGTRSVFWLACLPSVWLLAFFSKQNPGVFAPLLSTIAWVCFVRRANVLDILKTIGIGVFPALFIWVWLFGNPFQYSPRIWSDIWTHIWVLPGTIGRTRLAAWDLGVASTIRSLVWLPFQLLLPELNFQFRQLMVFPFYLYLAERIWCVMKKGSSMPVYPLKQVVTGIALLACSTLFIKTTHNQAENGLSLAFVALGFGLVFWKSWIDQGPVSRRWPFASRWVWYVLLAVISTTGLWAGIKFHQEVNTVRKVLDFQDAANVHSLYPPTCTLDGLVYQAPYEAGLLNPEMLLNWLSLQQGDVVYFGDLRFLLALAGKEDVLPSVWIHPGLTFPEPGSPGFDDFDLEFLGNIREKAVKHVIFESEHHQTYLGFRWEQLFHTAGYVLERKVSSHRIGGFEVWTLRDE